MHVCVNPKINVGKKSGAIAEVLLIDISVFRKYIVNDVNCEWENARQSITIFLQFTVFLQEFNLPQIKWNLTFNIINSVYELFREVPNELRPRNLVNQEIQRKSKNWVAMCPMDPPKTNF